MYEDPEKEDPTVYVSQKTGRGPISDDWIDEFSSACEGKEQPTEDGKAIMCAYKLCKVEFRYWGMQSKIERFIHDVALRKTMLKAHSQAWTWQVCRIVYAPAPPFPLSSIAQDVVDILYVDCVAFQISRPIYGSASRSLVSALHLHLSKD